ncbi:bestrophin-like domain [Glaciimonas soli]|uniref:DUF4239 domain-containing protein n=1 Tax=Glaciimonas soli TaxID=2590999 RepID=A0A843YQV4_9BURK|nr:DUF4239 domain-containing protein [Glaciimonas soli]MQR01470.1 DUF4239 domain-containing protein [Glaciimonas soli]
MSEIWSAILVFVLLLASTAIGVLVKPLLPEEHKAHETVQLMQLVMGMLITFAALVLGLMTTSARNHFDSVTNDIRAYSADLIQLDVTFREYGADMDFARRNLRAYTAAAIATTWPDEIRPAGDYYPKDIPAENNQEKLEDFRLGAMLHATEQQVRRVSPHDAFHQSLLDVSLTQFDRVIQARWKLIEEAHSSISLPFFSMLALWLMIIFLSFGLVAPRNALALVTITLGALSIASSLYVIVDLDTPFTGPIVVASQPMRDALMHMNR